MVQGGRAAVSRDDIYPMLRLLYAHLTRDTKRAPSVVHGELYASEAELATGKGALAAIRKTAQAPVPYCTNDIPYTFAEITQQAIAKVRGQEIKEDVDDTCRMRAYLRDLRKKAVAAKAAANKTKKAASSKFTQLPAAGEGTGKMVKNLVKNLVKMPTKNPQPQKSPSTTPTKPPPSK